MKSLKDLAERVKELFLGSSQPRELISPVGQPMGQVQAVQPSVEDKIRKGFRAYADQYAGGAVLPIEKHIPQFVQAAEEYPIFRQHPYLLPQVSILESSAGRNVTRANNPLNWAARVQKRGDYAPQSWEESINDAITAIAGTRPSGPRQRQQLYYEPFRRSGDLRDFAGAYEPRGDFGASYARDLMEGIKLFE